MADRSYHTIVVGGGMAGLTSAVYLAKAGRRVLLIEKNKECGGLVSTFSRDGYHFEAGVRALENAGIIFPMLEELGLRLDVVKSPVSVGVGRELLNIENASDLDAYRDLLARTYPDSREEIDRVIRVIRRVMKHMDVLYGIENPNFKDLKKDRDYLFKKLLPWLPRFLRTIGKINRMNMPVEDYLEDLVSDPSLRDMITQHFFRNTPTFFALSYFSLYLDYFYPLGGVGKLAEAVEQKFLDLGGEVLRETSVTRVLAQQKKVQDHQGVLHAYDHLVWAADLKTLYRITDTGGFSARMLRRFGKTRDKLLARRGGDSVFSLYLMVDEAPDSFRSIAHGHFFYAPLREGLGQIHRSELDALIAGKVHEKEQILDWLDRFVALNTYEISIPVLKDPAMAPDGKTGLIVSFLTEYDLFQMMADAGWYREFIRELEDRIIGVLAGSVYPMLKDKVLGRFSFSPLSYASRVASSEGAITGWSFQESIPVIRKIQQANRAVNTALPSVYQAGQWTYSPAGVPMSVLTGKLAAQKVLKQQGQQD